MLFIGDIHITSKVQEKVLASLREFLEQRKNEKEIIFMGDFVYHFSYDKKALQQLFILFVEQAKLGKTLTILAGNHDRIASQFVYSEGKLALELSNTEQIHFITTPQWKTIEGVRCYFFPFHIPEQNEELLRYAENFAGNEIYSRELIDTIVRLTQSKLVGEQRSGWANLTCIHALNEHDISNDKPCLFIHHRYVEGVAFPGQFAQFSWKSPALSRIFLNDPNIKMVSGHLHQPFCFKNYLCCGSVWSTSPLEINQEKFLFSYDASTDTVKAYTTRVNPYYAIEYTGNHIDSNSILKKTEQIITDSEYHLQQGSWNITCEHSSPQHALITISVLVKEQEWSELTAYVEQELLNEVSTINIKQPQRIMSELLEELQSAGTELDKTISGWKTLLERFLEVKYGSLGHEYITLLKNLSIL